MICDKCKKEIEFEGIKSIKDILGKYEGCRDFLLHQFDKELRFLFETKLNSDLKECCKKEITEIWNGGIA